MQERAQQDIRHVVPGITAAIATAVIANIADALPVQAHTDRDRFLQCLADDGTS